MERVTQELDAKYVRIGEAICLGEHRDSRTQHMTIAIKHGFSVATIEEMLNDDPTLVDAGLTAFRPEAKVLRLSDCSTGLLLPATKEARERSAVVFQEQYPELSVRLYMDLIKYFPRHP